MIIDRDIERMIEQARAEALEEAAQAIYRDVSVQTIGDKYWCRVEDAITAIRALKDKRL